jgi:DNA polymerase III epsilon subunit-like protein
MSEPRIVLWDIETTHNIAAIFRLFEDYTSHENILQERYVVCAAWKVLGEGKVHAVSTLDNPKRYKRNPHDDRHVCEALHAVLSAADVIVAHNGDQYDIKFTEGRMLAHGLSPLPPITSIDTLKVAKSRLLLNSNKLDYLARYLGFGKKIRTENQLWLDILRGGPAAATAIKKMVEYNKHDVVLLEKVFLKLRPYCANHINRALFGKTEGCPRCGSRKFQSRGSGTHKAISRVYRRFQCNSCGGWWREAGKSLVPTLKTRIL